MYTNEGTLANRTFYPVAIRKAAKLARESGYDPKLADVWLMERGHGTDRVYQVRCTVARFKGEVIIINCPLHLTEAEAEEYAAYSPDGIARIH